MATTNALPWDDQGNENNLERLHAQADEETVIFNAIGLADLIEEQRAVGTSFSIGLQMQPGKSSRTTGRLHL